MLKLGEIEIYPLKDGGFSLNQQRFFGTLAESKLVRVPVFAFLVKINDDYVLIDAGDGGYFGPAGGKLLSELHKIGVSENEIKSILITHLHPDHIGGLPNFKNAKIYVPRIDYDFWIGLKDESYKSPEYFDFAKKIFSNIKDNLVLFEVGDQLLNHFLVVDAGGHTPGQVNFLLDKKLLFIADVFHNLETQINSPEKPVIIDYYPKLGVKTRLKILELSLKNNWIWAGAHLFPTGFCKINKVNQSICYETEIY
jgi:glyoxylase-like metal-dependent hydrolase (beta-lactamase superfamily II)